MKVVDHEPSFWFLLKEGSDYYLDVHCSRSLVGFSILVKLTPSEYREYHALGRVFLEYLAARIQYWSREYEKRDFSKPLGKEVTQAVHRWREQKASKATEE